MQITSFRFRKSPNLVLTLELAMSVFFDISKGVNGLSEAVKHSSIFLDSGLSRMYAISFHFIQDN